MPALFAPDHVGGNMRGEIRNKGTAESWSPERSALLVARCADVTGARWKASLPIGISWTPNELTSQGITDWSAGGFQATGPHAFAPDTG